MTLKNKCKFSGLLFQEQPNAVLQTSFAKGHLKQSYLFYGDESCGRHSAALAFAALLQCQAPVKDKKGLPEACGCCESCRRIASGSHPEVLEIAPEGAEIRISQVRHIQELAALKPSFGKWQIFILDPAECLNVSSANSLLKTLEEAPDHSVFILIARNTEALLPTVVSRCEGVRFSAPAHEEARKEISTLFDVSYDEAAGFYALAEGRFGQALNMASKKDIASFDAPLGIRASHRAFLNEIENQSALIQNEISSAKDLEEALKLSGKTESFIHMPFIAARKAFCRDLFVNAGFPYAFPLLFTEEYLRRLDKGRDDMKKGLAPVLADAKKNYNPNIFKESEALINSSLDKWASAQTDSLILSLMGFYRDALLSSCGCDESLLLNIDRKNDIISVGRVEGTALLRSRIDTLEESYYMLHRYVQPSFILENLITQMGGPEA